MGWNTLTLMAPSIELSKLENCFRLWLSMRAKQKASISFSTSFADICLQITWVLIGQGSLGLIGYNLFRKLQNSLVQSYVRKWKLIATLGIGRKLAVNFVVKTKIFSEKWNFTLRKRKKPFQSLLLYCIVKVKNVVQMFPMRNIKKFSARINLQIENISFYILFSGSEVVFMRVRSFVVWWRIKHKRK